MARRALLHMAAHALPHSVTHALHGWAAMCSSSQCGSRISTDNLSAGRSKQGTPPDLMARRGSKVVGQRLGISAQDSHEQPAVDGRTRPVRVRLYAKTPDEEGDWASPEVRRLVARGQQLWKTWERERSPQAGEDIAIGQSAAEAAAPSSPDPELCNVITVPEGDDFADEEMSPQGHVSSQWTVLSNSADCEEEPQATLSQDTVRKRPSAAAVGQRARPRTRTCNESPSALGSASR